jgi:hypothetical protein
MPSLHVSASEHGVAKSGAGDDAAIGAWFQRAGRLARSVMAGHITLAEAGDDLVAELRCASEVAVLRRAVWDAETLLGDDALVLVLLRLATERVTRPNVQAR